MRRYLSAIVLAVSLLALPAAALATHGLATDHPISAVGKLARQLFYADRDVRLKSLAALRRRGKTDVVPALIQALRFIPDGEALNAALEALVGERPGDTWHDWMLWQESHPEIDPFAGFDRFKADIMAIVDENFRMFLRPGVEHEIRLEEIAWGGVAKDGIPALIDPDHIAAAEADYLEDDELVFGVAIDGDARAYPLRILDWHEMFNDVVGGVPVALAYCTLCGSGILYETRLPPRPKPFVFGSSGFLYRSNKLMYDIQTHSLWNQFTGRPVVGPLTGSGVVLKVRPVAITSWRKWRQRHPKTKVLSQRTGYVRDYTPGQPYGSYFASPDLMFPARVPDKRLKPKDQVFALRAGGHEKAWPLSTFAGGKVVNDTVVNDTVGSDTVASDTVASDTVASDKVASDKVGSDKVVSDKVVSDKVGALDVVLIGDAETRTVRAYDAGGRDFTRVAGSLDEVAADGKTWKVTEDALIGPAGERLPRLAGHIAYWFAWQGFKPAAGLSVK